MSTSTTISPSTSVTSSSSGKGLVSAQGKTSISDSVVQKIAGIAAREVAGVHALGSTGGRAIGALRERVSSSPSVTQGVSVEVGETQAAVDLTAVVDYGVSISDVAQAIRRNVIGSVERMTGLQVTEVNVTVDDVYIPSEDDGAQQSEPSRVQ